MPIQSIRPVNVNSVPFKSAQKEQVEKNLTYENPISRKTERNLAILSSVGGSTLIGVIAGGAATLLKKGWKIPTYVGVAAGLVSLALSLPAKLYNVKVGAFSREKEMDVFSRKKEAQTAIYEGINQEVQNEEVPLAEKIKNYSTVAMADNGKGMLVKGV